jgi:hypothetical protein
VVEGTEKECIVDANANGNQGEISERKEKETRAIAEEAKERIRGTLKNGVGGVKRKG